VRPARNRTARAFRSLRSNALFRAGFHETVAGAPLLWHLVIPGWSHFLSAQRTRGRLFLWPWLLSITLGMLFFGTTIGSLLLGTALSIHVSAAMDVVTPYLRNPTLRRRMAYSVAFAVLFAMALYLPAGRLITHWADPITLQIPSGPFQAGEVLLVNHAIKDFRRGQLVQFDIGELRDEVRNHNYIIYTGDRIDRIIALPGDVVRWERGRLSVNGAQSAIQPLAPGRLPAVLGITVPANHYLAFPSTTPTLGPNTPEETWMALSLIPKDRIKGVVYFRKHPLLKMKVLR